MQLSRGNAPSALAGAQRERIIFIIGKESCFPSLKKIAGGI